MLKYKQIVILSAVVLLCGQAICEDVLPEKKHTTTTPKPETTTEVDPTSSSDVPTTTSSTVAPTTTTPTTTEKPSTTTASTTTPTPAPPSTTPKPGPMPKPQTGSWFFTDAKTNQTCVIVQMAIQLKFNYTNTENKVVETTHNIPVNGSRVLEGSCTNTTQMIKIETNENCTFSLTFLKEKESFELSDMMFVLDGTAMGAKDPQITIHYTNKTFVTPITRSYYCTKEQTIFANDTAAATPAQIVLSHVQLEAFHTKTAHEFSSAKDCDAMETPDIVPIAVGISLAALVVVVLIAYLVARHRSQARGYMSM
ncbi:lysosome-associated membrane glycoprotein 1-like [Culicoides brevitarsis]|uniref:lysosome-associated membrane glycoprotein 1-like n=1 Tax=Culicoides brevitarsis TaxID=469753 RepID=UPI00307B1A3B